jgi:hypothetical protein
LHERAAWFFHCHPGDQRAGPRVWDAYSVEKSRSAWQRIPGPDSALTLDFRVGGWERLTGSSAANGTAEVIASHALFLDGVRRWVSLISIAFEPIQDATRITHTEQYTFLAWADDGTHDQAHLRGSTQLAFNALAALVELATWNSRENGLALVGLLTPTLTGTGTEAPKVHTPSATVNRVRLGGAASTEPSFEAPSAVARHLR